MWLPEHELGGAQRLLKAYKRAHDLGWVICWEFVECIGWLYFILRCQSGWYNFQLSCNVCWYTYSSLISRWEGFLDCIAWYLCRYILAQCWSFGFDLFSWSKRARKGAVVRLVLMCLHYVYSAHIAYTELALLSTRMPATMTI